MFSEHQDRCLALRVLVPRYLYVRSIGLGPNVYNVYKVYIVYRKKTYICYYQIHFECGMHFSIAYKIGVVW